MSEWLIYFKFPVLCNDISKVFREEAVPRMAKKEQSSDVKSFTQIHLTVFVEHSSVFCQNCPKFRTNTQCNIGNFKILRNTSNSCILW